MSAWTGDEVGAASKKPDRPKTSRGRDPQQPDSEKLVETIVTLRQEKNVHEEQIKLLKTTIMRLKKQLTIQEREKETSQPDFIKYRDPTSMQPHDVDSLLFELRRMKLENQSLQDER